jgi:hypothetical protein
MHDMVDPPRQPKIGTYTPRSRLDYPHRTRDRPRLPLYCFVEKNSSGSRGVKFPLRPRPASPNPLGLLLLPLRKYPPNS